MKMISLVWILILATSRMPGSPADKLLDGWYELDQIVSVRMKDGPVNEDRRALGYDTEERAAGDFSIRYRHRTGWQGSRLVFHPYPHETWELCDTTDLGFWFHTETAMPFGDMNLHVEIRDRSGMVSRTPLPEPASDLNHRWTRFDRRLSEFQDFARLDHRALAEVSITGDFPDDLVLRVDEVRFSSPHSDRSVLGISAKSLSQRMEEARASRRQRAKAIYSAMRADEQALLLSSIFARFWLADDLGAVNADLELLLGENRDRADKEFGFSNPWSLLVTPWILRLYFTFGPGTGETHNRLSASSEERLLELLWERTKGKNDIHWARHRNPWIMDGSENHDINGIVSNYLSSQIFKGHLNFKNRVYPNPGAGGGPGYWFHRDRGQIRFYGPLGGATLTDGREYVAADHYEAWGGVIRDVIVARAKRGFFLEQASPTYMKYTLGFLLDVYEFAGDSSMRRLIKDFLDLVWIQWALESLHGQRGGGKTRDHTVLNVEGDSMFQMARFFLGGHLTQTDLYYSLPSSTYELPDLVWRIALDRKGLGRFALVSRVIGEESPNVPRAPGLERSLNLDSVQRMFRYTWITPHSILGAQMDHPLAIHSHLSPTSRLYGINFSSHPDARIFPHGIRWTAANDWEIVRRGGPMYRAVQHEHVLVSQQSRGYLQINPDWFPQRSLAPVPIAVYFSPHLDEIVEKGGWIFARAGAGFAAVRLVEGEYMAGDGIEETVSFTKVHATESLLEPLREESYRWNRDRTLAVANNSFAGLVMETSDTERHENLAAFMDAILAARLELRKTVVPGWYILIYEGTGGAPVIEFNLSNNEIPRTGGKSLDYEPPFLFNSPYLRSVYESGRVEASFGGIIRRFDFGHSRSDAEVHE